MMRSIIPVLLVVTVAGAGCSDDDDSTSSFCDDRVELQDSIRDLRDVNVVDDGIDALDSQLETVLADVDALEASAEDLAPEVDALKTSVETLQASVASAETPGDKATALVSGLDGISAAWESLMTASGSECDD
jgi:hypothetical protein